MKEIEKKLRNIKKLISNQTSCDLSLATKQLLEITKEISSIIETQKDDPCLELLGPKNTEQAKAIIESNFKILEKSYVHGVAKNIRPLMHGRPEVLQEKLEGIFNGLGDFLYKTENQRLLKISKSKSIESESKAYAERHWRQLANSIATHVRKIHKDTENSPELLYIALNKPYRTAKVVVLRSPSRTDIYHALTPDTKAINNWTERLCL